MSLRIVASCAVGLMYAFMLEYQTRVLMRGEKTQEGGVALLEALYTAAFKLSQDCALKKRPACELRETMASLFKLADRLVAANGLERLVFARHRELFELAAEEAVSGGAAHKGHVRRLLELNVICADLKTVSVEAVYGPWLERGRWMRIDRATQRTSPEMLSSLVKSRCEDPAAVEAKQLRETQRELDAMAKAKTKSVRMELVATKS